MIADQKRQLAARFDEYVNELRFCARLRSQTIQGYLDIFTLFLKLMPEVSDVDMLSSGMVVDFFKRLQMRQRYVGRNVVCTGIKSSTIRTYWGRLNSFFEWLLIKKIIDANPLQNLRPPETTQHESGELGEDDARRLYAAISLHSPNTLVQKRDTAMISLFAFCGIRLGEFISLEVQDIDFEKRLLTIRGNTSKSKRVRHIPIHPTLLFHLREYIAERNKRNYKTNWLIVSSLSDKGLSRHGLKNWVKSLVKKSGVRFHLHQFRHAFACNLARKDVNAVKIQKLLGHSSLNMTMTYLRSIETQHMQDDIGKLSI